MDLCSLMDIQRTCAAPTFPKQLWHTCHFNALLCEVSSSRFWHPLAEIVNRGVGPESPGQLIPKTILCVARLSQQFWICNCMLLCQKHFVHNFVSEP